jgi:hypothetical protein
MFLDSSSHHKTPKPARAGSICPRRFDPRRSSSQPALMCAFLLISLGLAVQPVHAQTREHILLARQVGLPETQAVVVLVSNQSHQLPGHSCHFTGKARIEEVIPPFGSGLNEFVFEPVSLGPGKSLAIDIPPPDIPGPGANVVPSQTKVLIIGFEAHNAASASCPLMVQAFGYDADSGATEVLIDRFTMGAEKTSSAQRATRSPVPLAFVGGAVDQSARLILFSDNTSGLPADHCRPTGEVIAQVVPRLADDPDDRARSIERSWPIKWEGPTIKSGAIVDVPFDTFDRGLPADQRVDAVLSLRFHHPLPAACLKWLSGSLQIVNGGTGATQAVIPVDRAFFNYHHFRN